MSEINASKLKAKIVENNLTQANTASRIGITANSLCRKINGKNEFTLSEVLGLCSLLHITNPCEIFLPSMSQICNEQKTA